MPRNRERGAMRGSYALDPVRMVRLCRRLAEDMRAEAKAGWPPIEMALPGARYRMTRAQAAESMDRQGDRWAIEAGGGERNMIDRERMGVL
jgi:hypothetical protein